MSDKLLKKVIDVIVDEIKKNMKDYVLNVTKVAEYSNRLIIEITFRSPKKKEFVKVLLKEFLGWDL